MIIASLAKGGTADFLLPKAVDAAAAGARGAGGMAGAGGVDAGTIMAIAAAGLGAAIVAWTILAAVRRDRRRHGPTVRHLGRSLGLAADDRRLVAGVARSAGVVNPGAMLISRGCFDAAVGAVRAAAACDAFGSPDPVTAPGRVHPEPASGRAR